VRELCDWGSELVDRLEVHLRRIDAVADSMQKICKEMDTMRQDVAGLLFEQLKQLRDTGVVGRDASKEALYQALDVLESGAAAERKNVPPLLKTKVHAKAISQMIAKRPRNA